jgi:peptidoglycan/xylan/chitin deacetylase (PgdA/CDA1 family)
MVKSKSFKIPVIAVFLFLSCAASPKEKPGLSWLDINGGNIVIYTYTRAGIEAEIEERWRGLGYRTKPDKYIALSFDDGPCGPFDSGGTQALLAKLRELNVKATFFAVGQNIRSYRTAARAIIDAGHELANHSDSFDPLGGADEKEIKAGIDAASQAIMEITGKYPYFFRAPNLNHGDSLSKVCGERGMPLIDGSVHNDWPGSAAAILQSVLDNPRDGDIIILHENNTSPGNTVSVLTQIVGGLRERGFWILTVGQLAAVKEKPLVAGERYGAIRN